VCARASYSRALSLSLFLNRVLKFVAESFPTQKKSNEHKHTKKNRTKQKGGVGGGG
jgi:hypothetical protein